MFAEQDAREYRNRDMRRPVACAMIASVSRIMLVVLLVAAIVIVVFAAGWADDKARPGSTGRAPVTRTSP